MGNGINQIHSLDLRRDIAVPGDHGATISYCVEHWIRIANESIKSRGAFYVALSGGSTPKVIFQALANNQERVDWEKVYLFWSDERCVAPDNPESNYKMAMDNGLSRIPIPKSQIFRMKGEVHPEESALEYDEVIHKNIPNQVFDLVMLGMGDDGHTASLFPKTHGLHTLKRDAIANYIPQKDCWRLTLTFDSINKARNIVIYVLGESKAEMVKSILFGAENINLLPSQKIGTPSNHALWILDEAAAKYIPFMNEESPPSSFE